MSTKIRCITHASKYDVELTWFLCAYDGHQDAMGYSALMRHVMGITDEERQARREELLSTTAKEFKEFAEYMQSFSDKGQIVAVSSESDAQSVQESKPEVKLEMNNVV